MGKQNRIETVDAGSRLPGTVDVRPRPRQSTLNRRLTLAVWKGRKVIQPTPRQIQLDIDGHRALAVHTRQWHLLRAFHAPARRWKARITPSSTRGHVHVTVTLPRARPLTERILLAVLLGDDLKRGLFNYARALRRSKVPVAFFED